MLSGSYSQAIAQLSHCLRGSSRSLARLKLVVMVSVMLQLYYISMARSAEGLGHNQVFDKV
jgi:hypothetical protein